MQKEFHYYATYTAAYLAGFSHEESVEIAYSAALVDFCSEDYLAELSAPARAATTQLQLEMVDTNSDWAGRRKITEIWASFHFLPGDLYREVKKGGRRYEEKYRLICDVNSDLLVKTVELARGKGLQAVGLALHILADTWAHRYFAGTPSLVINNTNYSFYERVPGETGYEDRPVVFRHNPSGKDDPEKGIYVNTIYRSSENSVMNLGHGRAGHLPDYSFAVYRYLPAWGDYEEVLKNNPEDFRHAFGQMVYALKCLRTETPFEKDTYDTESVGPLEEEIRRILTHRSVESDLGWKELGEKLSGKTVPDFSVTDYCEEYRKAADGEKEETVLGRFFAAAIRQKNMVTQEICQSGNRILLKRKWGKSKKNRASDTK